LFGRLVVSFNVRNNAKLKILSWHVAGQKMIQAQATGVVLKQRQPQWAGALEALDLPESSLGLERNHNVVESISVESLCLDCNLATALGENSCHCERCEEVLIAISRVKGALGVARLRHGPIVADRAERTLRLVFGRPSLVLDDADADRRSWAG